jgi:hypothetical protein
MSPSHSNRSNHNPSDREGSSLATSVGVARALDELIARFPRRSAKDESALGLSLPPVPMPEAAQSEDVIVRLKILACLITEMLDRSEATGRENDSLRQEINKSYKFSNPPARPEKAKVDSDMRVDTMTGVVQALDEILLLFPQITSGTQAALWFALPASVKSGANVSEDLKARLDALSVRITDQLFNIEANAREIGYLRLIIEQRNQNPNYPPKADEGSNS